MDFMTSDYEITLDRYGIVEISSAELLELVSAAAISSAGAEEANKSCVNNGCGAEINQACRGSNSNCFAAANVACDTNLVCVPA